MRWPSTPLFRSSRSAPARYDGGYHFKGELFLLSLETGVAVPLIEPPGRQVLGLEWLDEQALRVLMAPPDDWKDPDARTEGHVAVVRRSDWSTVPPGSLTSYDLAGPQVPAPRPRRPRGRPRGGDAAEHGLGAAPRGPRGGRHCPTGAILAALDGVLLEAWLPLRGARMVGAGGQEAAAARSWWPERRPGSRPRGPDVESSSSRSPTVRGWTRSPRPCPSRSCAARTADRRSRPAGTANWTRSRSGRGAGSTS